MGLDIFSQGGIDIFGSVYSDHLLPAADDTYDLGSAAFSWRNLYVDSLIYVTSTVMQGDFLPSLSATYDIGSATYVWAEAYIGDADDYVTIKAVSDVPSIFGTGAYLRIGDAQTTQVSLAAEDDLMVSGKLEVYGLTYHTGIVFVGDTNVTNTKMTTGVTIDQGAADDEAFTLKSSDIDTGSNAITESDTYFSVQKAVATKGGVRFTSLMEHGTSTWSALEFYAYGAVPHTTKDTSESVCLPQCHR